MIPFVNYDREYEYEVKKQAEKKQGCGVVMFCILIEVPFHGCVHVYMCVCVCVFVHIHTCDTHTHTYKYAYIKVHKVVYLKFCILNTYVIYIYTNF